MLAHFPRQQTVALPLAVDDIGKSDWFLSWECAAKWLNEHFDLAAARQPDVERHLVADPVRDQAWMVFFEDLFGVLDDVVFDASA